MSEVPQTGIKRDGNGPEAGGSGVDLRRLAHELRTPLGAIAALSEIMRDERLGPLGSEKYREYARGIHDSSQHAINLLRSYLDPLAMQRPETLPFEFVELDLACLVSDCVAALVPLAAAEGVAIGHRAAVGSPRVIADRRSVRQIVDNVVANALKFTPPGGRIDVFLGYTAGGPLVIEITDSGDGMTAAELSRARSGTAASEPLRRRSGGTGYGLPLVHMLAAANGASLTIESRLRHGTRIAIAFPPNRIVV